MLVAVELLTKKLMKSHGFDQIISDFELTKTEILQILEDHGYINLEVYDNDD